ncbi:MAG: Crp/Fnr family transcriptional regulator [Deltaproteobacteria bacterium]|nr:Crp/Fnr family transcriptional regulator [Deltaproteobacteria bacterium]
MEDKVDNIIANVGIFGSLNAQDIKTLAKMGEKKHWLKGHQIISEGEEGTALYLILSGKVKVVLYGEDGREIVLSIMKDGDVFGEMALFDGEPRSASVEAIEDTECFIIQGNDLLEYIKVHPAVALNFLSHLSRRLREADRKIGGLALLDVCGRIAHTFLGIAKNTAGGVQEKKVVAIERLTHEEIAAMIGSSREVVSRALKKMTQEGYIKVEKERFVLHI